MKIRDFIVDLVLLIGIVLLLPLAIPIAVLAFLFLLVQRSGLWPRRAHA